MKFAHEFRAALADNQFPAHWVNSAIPYSELKKCLRNVAAELQRIGLEPGVLRELLSRQELTYNLDHDGSNHLRPKLTVLVHVKDGIPFDAALSPDTRGFLQKLASQTDCVDREHAGSSAPGIAADGSQDGGGVELVELPLVFDEKFFSLLQDDFNNLEALQESEERLLKQEIVDLGKDVSQLTKPRRMHKSDMNRWRSIFDIYINGQIFFATHEQDHGARTAAEALDKLKLFEEEVRRQNLVSKFKLKESNDAYTRFVQVNKTLLKGMRFQEINRLAVAKILKKFDKRTALGVSGRFPEVVKPVSFLSVSLAKDMCAQLSTELLSLLPRLDDYLCPVCMSIAYMPVRLSCNHLFCIRCVVVLQRTKIRCPICRSTSLGEADARNLDDNMEKFMRKYFPKETSEKQWSNEVDRGREAYGDDFEPDKCTVM